MLVNRMTKNCPVETDREEDFFSAMGQVRICLCVFTCNCMSTYAYLDI
jgi:hypothetical protein